MNLVETEAPSRLAVKADEVFSFPRGILGFENIKRYVLLKKEEEDPFLWLQMVDDPSLAFLVVPPFPVLSTFNPIFDPEDFSMLGIEREEQVLLLSIVTMSNGGAATANLKGPLVINQETRIGAQLVLKNAAEYSVQEPLPMEESHNRI
jgi:flagellar assembly factor FliW